MNKESNIVENGIISPEAKATINNDSFLFSLPRVNDISPVAGGVTHRVFQIRSGDNRYYLKIRGDRFAAIPQITCNPADIVIENRALTEFNQVAPDNFPQVLSFNENLHYLILSDAIPNGEKMEDLFLKNKITPSMLFNLGSTLSRIHAASSSCQDSIRTGGDSAYYQTILNHRFGYRHNAVLDDMIQTLTDLDNKQLILGDVSPKNIGVNDDGKKSIFF